MLLLWLLKAQFFESKLMAEKILCFEMTNFRALDTLYNLFRYFQNNRLLIQITLCGNARIQIDISKNNCFSAEQANSYIPRTEKTKKVSICEMLEIFWVFLLPHTSNFILETEENSIQRKLYYSSII